MNSYINISVIGNLLPINMTTTMDEGVQRKIIEILRVLEECSKPVGARLVAVELKRRGYDLNERTVRYHMKTMDDRGLTQNLGYDGRVIAPKGREEIKNALMEDRMGFIITKIASLIFRMSFDIKTGEGDIIVNIGVLDKRNFPEALLTMKKAITAGYTVSPLVKVLREGECFGSYIVPSGKTAVATVCSITMDGVLHKAGIPTSPKFGGVVQITNWKPFRFSDAIMYSGSTLDPLDLFSVKGLSSILQTIKTGTGQILANYREIPMEAAEKAKESLETAAEYGIRGVLKIGEPNKAVLGIAPAINRVGLVFIGGTNALAAVSEKGIPVETKAVEGLMSLKDLINIDAI